MRIRIILGAVAVGLLAAAPAQAIPFVADFTIHFGQPPDGDFSPLTGVASLLQLDAAGNSCASNPGPVQMPNPPPIDIGRLLPGDSFQGVFGQPGPVQCPGGVFGAFGFQFGGMSGQFPAIATVGFLANLDLANILVPDHPPIIPLGNASMYDTCTSEDACEFGGQIVAFDAPVQVGSWNVSLHAVPEPASLAFLAPGLALLFGVSFARRRRAG